MAKSTTLCLVAILDILNCQPQNFVYNKIVNYIRSKLKMTAEDQNLDVVICRACLIDCKDYKPLHREGIIFGEITTLATLLSFLAGLDINEEDNMLPDHLCSRCVKDLSISYIFKKKVLESNEVLRSQLTDDDEENEERKATTEEAGKQEEHEKENQKQRSQESCQSETDLKEAAQMKRELEASQLYETTEEEYTVIRNEADNETMEQQEEPMEEDDMYVVQEVAETTEIYHTTEIEGTHENSQPEEHHEEEHHTIVDIVEESDIQQVDEDEEEVAYEIHVTENLDEEYHEIITSDPVPPDNKQEKSKKNYTLKTNFNIKPEVHNYESSDSGQNTTAGKRSRNRTKSTSKAPNPDFQCKICFKQLSNSSSFKYHMQLHSDETPYECEICGERFKTRNAHDGHRATHDPKNTCELCGKVYRQPSSLRLHMLSHTGEKPFKCDICGKCLTQKSGYKKHMLTHTGEKPYPCDVCGKRFRISSNMLVHRRGHFGEKTFGCSECDRTFGTSDQLKRHMLTHTDETPFSCDICDKRFKRQSTLKAHILNHSTGENV
ncbi:uncharacterized protein [Musca autumnalis]|uniref:uncharacterized protein n=1 Tax=Musca autumnalis TaxID=221902 RepID=UPI003CEDE2B3